MKYLKNYVLIQNSQYIAILSIDIQFQLSKCFSKRVFVNLWHNTFYFELNLPFQNNPRPILIYMNLKNQMCFSRFLNPFIQTITEIGMSAYYDQFFHFILKLYFTRRIVELFN